MKKVLSAVILAIIIFSCGAISAFAISNGTCGENLTWMLDDVGTLTISGAGEMDNWSYYTGAPWNEYADNVVKVVIEGEVTSIGEYAFYNCNNLTDATIGSGVLNIKSEAFYDCDNLKRVELSYGVTGIGSLAFGECYSLTEINLPESITNISNYAFRNCSSLTSINLPEKIVVIGDYTFKGCRGLTNVNIPDGVTEIGASAFYDCESLVSVDVPESVTRIEDMAFSHCGNLKDIVLPEGVTHLGSYVFDNCNSLENVRIPEGVEGINYGTFRGCGSLESIAIPDNVKYIQSDAFRECNNLSDITIGINVVSIGEYAFYNCSNLMNIIIPDRVTSIGESAFSGCTKLVEIIIPDSVTFIGDSLLLGCSSLQKVIIGNQITKIPDKTFQHCSNLINVVIPNAVTEIGVSAFENCYKLKNINIPDKVTSIESRTFYNCSALENISIGNGVTNVRNDAFKYCSSLNAVNITDMSAWCNILFFNADANPLSNAKKLYLNGELVTELIVPDGTEIINNYTFYQYRYLTSVTLPDSVTIIGYETFYQCNNLSEITIGKGLQEVGYRALYLNDDIDVYYNGTEEDWNQIYIEYSNYSLVNASKYYFAYVTLIDENQNEISKVKWERGSEFDAFEMLEQKIEHTVQLYTDKECVNEFDLTTPINEDIMLYVRYVLNKYTYKFIDYDGKIISEKLVGFGTVITVPESPIREKTQQYSYTFVGWENYFEGVTQSNMEMVFTATYDVTVNKYTYTFFDENESVLKKETAEYGTIIIPPEVLDKEEYYVFDYWQNYTENMELTSDINFKAIYKYVDYAIEIEGNGEEIKVTYGDDYVLPVQEIKDFEFLGYYTEKDGKGVKLTDEKGKSIKPYDFSEKINAYPYYVHSFLNKLIIKGMDEVEIGTSEFVQVIEFATDKEAKYLTCTVIYPETFKLTDVTEKEFALVNINSQITKNGFIYTELTGIYNYTGETIPLKQTVEPFELVFNISKEAEVGEVKVEISDIALIYSQNKDLISGTSKNIIIMPKLSEKIEIFGPASIDTQTQFIAMVYPEYTTNKEVEWSVDDENIATISENGILTPVKNGTVVVKATTKDDSKIASSFCVEVTAYAKIKELNIDALWNKEFSENIYEYTLYVKENVDFVTVRAEYDSGALLVNNALVLPGFNAKLNLPDEQTVFVFDINNVEGMTDKQYTVTVIKLDGSKTEVSNDGKVFDVTHINAERGRTVICALYKNEMLVEIQSTVYEGEKITFNTVQEYANAKIMIWDSIANLKPICQPEYVK